MAMRDIEKGQATSRVVQNVKTARKALGWTLLQLGDHMGGDGLSEGQLTRLESMDRRIDVEDVWNLAAAFDIPPEVLLVGSEADVLSALTQSVQVVGYRNMRNLEARSPGRLLDRVNASMNRRGRSAGPPFPQSDSTSSSEEVEDLDPAALRSMASAVARESVAAIDLDSMRAFLATSGVGGEQLIDEIRTGLTAMTTLLTTVEKALAEDEDGAS